MGTIIIARDHGPLIDGTVDGGPDSGPARRHGGDDAPIGAKVLDAPNNTDDDGSDAEGGAVTQAGESGDEREERGIVLDEGGGEKDLRKGEEEGTGKEEAETR